MKKPKTALIMFECIVAAAICVAIGIVLFNMFASKKSSDSSSSKKESSNVSIKGSSVDYVDADDFFSEQADSVKKIKANKSNSVQSEKDASKDLSERGFEEVIVSSYSADGKFYEEEEIDEDSKTKHPVYTTTYASKSDIYWTISEINGQIIAYPASYNLQEGIDKEVYISEKKYITGYDSVTNSFFEIVPKKSVAKIKTVKKIDTDTLDQITIEELENL